MVKHRYLAHWFAACVLACAPSLALATTFLMVNMTTGADDLRGGNRAYITMVLRDGTVIPERPLVTTRGLAGGSRTGVRAIRFPEDVDLSRIAAFRIRHDGSPRSGHPFDTYDNWDLRAVTITARRSSGATVSYRSSGALVHRFTGESRQVDLPVAR
jgi:hypothetical protein